MHCSSAQCSGSFSECPDPGAHNTHGVVQAAYCVCACCDNPSGCTVPNYLTYTANYVAACSQYECSTRFSQCPNNPSNGQLLHAYFLAPPPPPTLINAMTAAATATPVGPEKQESTSNLTIFLVVIAAVPFVIGGGILMYRRCRNDDLVTPCGALNDIDSSKRFHSIDGPTKQPEITEDVPPVPGAAMANP